MDIGTHLREARERRGMTLREVADSTKLSTTVLGQIERNDFSRLAAGIYTRGYLRAYAAAVGVDSDVVVRAYVAQLPPDVVEDPPPQPVLNFARSHHGLLVASALSAIVTVSAVVAFLGFMGPRPESNAGNSTEALQTPVTTGQVAIGSASPRVLPADDEDPGLFVEIQPLGPCWVSALADGDLVLSKLLHAGERVTVVAGKELVLRVGAPGQFTYTLNGRPGRLLGDGSRPVTVTITDANYRTFLAEPDEEDSQAAVV